MEIMTVLIPLPRYYNPDASGTRREVEDAKLIQTADEAAMAFEAGGTLYKYERDDTRRGVWWNRGMLERDVLSALEIDVPDTPGNRAWFEAWAADVLLDRFQQTAIYVKFIGGGASVTTRLITKEDRRGTAGGPT
jgi:hypothetical protein